MKIFELPPSPVARPRGKRANSWRDYEWHRVLPFAVVHILALGGLFTGATWQDWVCCAVLYFARVFGVTAGYHRYFSHRTFKTSRVMQFLLAVLAQTTMQRGALWWAHHHRHHHRYSDTEHDVHSASQWGFLHSHISWIYDGTHETDYAKIKDFARYPELVILNKLFYVPPVMLGFAVYFMLGWSGLFVGFMLSTVLVCHATFAVNSLAHVWGNTRFDTGETSRNHWLLAIILLGEGWHNNHHYYQSSARVGFYWWEIDVTWYILVVMEKLGLIWGLRGVPAHVYEVAEGRSPGSSGST